MKEKLATWEDVYWSCLIISSLQSLSIYYTTKDIVFLIGSVFLFLGSLYLLNKLTGKEKWKRKK